MQKKTTIITSLAGAAIALVALAGCTAPAAESGKESKPSASSQQEKFTPEKKDFECVDGVAKADASNTILTLAGDCKSVEVTGVNSLVNLNGKVETVSVGGSINKVVVKDVQSVTFVKDSSGNTVETAAKPKVTENGTQNEVVAPK